MFGAATHPRNLEACLRDLAHSEAKVRAAAARDLARHAEAPRGEVVGALERALCDGAGDVRAAAATSLADLGAVESMPALLAAADDSSAFARQMVIAALGELAREKPLVRDDDLARRVRARLSSALEDDAPEVRFQAVIAFPRLATDADEAVLAVEGATRDEDPLVVQAALRAAEELGDAAGAVDARLLRRARALLGHEVPVVRVAAAVCLARGGETGAEEVLAAVVRGDLATQEGSDEAAAIELAGELGIESARQALSRRAFGGALGFFRDRFQWHARVALARMGDARARSEIVRDLDAWDPNRRTLAVAAAGRAKLVDTKPQLVAMRRDGRADLHALDEALRSLSEAEREEAADAAPFDAKPRALAGPG